MVGILQHPCVLHYVFLFSVSVVFPYDLRRVVVSTIGIYPSSVLLWNEKKLNGNYMIIGGYMQTMFTNDYQFRNQYHCCCEITGRSFHLVSDRFLRDVSESYYSEPCCQPNQTNSTLFHSNYLNSRLLLSTPSELLPP